MQRKEAFSPPANTAVPPNNSHKRTAPGPVVGWPPIHSFRKNLASSSPSKLGFKSPSAAPRKVANEKATVEPSGKGLFVKINMDGFPIGRKVDLKAYDTAPQGVFFKTNHASCGCTLSGVKNFK